VNNARVCCFGVSNQRCNWSIKIVMVAKTILFYTGLENNNVWKTALKI